MPAIVTGLRISAGQSVIGAVVGTYESNLDSEQMFGAVLLASLPGLVVFWAFGLLAWFADRWRGVAD